MLGNPYKEKRFVGFMERNEKKEMIDFYLSRNLKVHIKTSTGKFYNGEIVEWENDSVIVFKDRFIGLMHIFVSQIIDLQEYQEERR